MKHEGAKDNPHIAPEEKGLERRRFLGTTILAVGAVAVASSRAVTAQEADSHKHAATVTPVVESSAAFNVAPSLQVFPTPPVRPNIKDVSDEKLAVFKNAINIIKQRPGSDRTSYAFQADIHKTFCPGSLGSANQIHFKWWFLPWHRAYLYFFERILQKAVSDNTLALPYWDWRNDRKIPQQYWGDASNPLFRAGRQQTPNDELPDDYIDVKSALQAKTFSLFGGTSGTNTPGQLEFITHNNVHGWVDGDMGSFDTAARDPLFWAHHANVDRYWHVWLRNPENKNPSSSEWLNKTFKFWNEDGQEVQVTVQQTLTMSRYSSVQVPLFSAANTGQRLTLRNTPVTIPTVRLPRDRVNDEALFSSAADRGRVALLRIEGVELPSDAPVTVRVFLNAPDANARTSVERREFAGTFTVIPLARQPHGGPGALANLLVDVTGKIENVRDVSITLVPVDGDTGPAAGGTLSFGGITLETRPPEE